MANLPSEDSRKYLNNCHLDVDAKLYGDLLCVICQRIMQKPFQGPCGCKYCHKCIGDYLDGGEKMCPGKLADCKTRLLRMGSNLHEDNIANKKISLIPLQCAAEYCQYRNSKTSMVRNIASHQLGPHRRPHMSGDTDQSPMSSTTSPLDCAIDCRVAMLAETIHNWRTEIGFMKDWADENRIQINKLERDNENLKATIFLLEAELQRLRNQILAIDPVGLQLVRGLDFHANTLSDIIQNWRTEIWSMKAWALEVQANINELAIENQGMKAEICLLRAGDQEKKRFEKNENVETEIVKIEKLRKRIRILKMEKKIEREKTQMLKGTHTQDDKDNKTMIVAKALKHDERKLLDKDESVEDRQLVNIVKENAKFFEKIKRLQQDQNKIEMVMEEAIVDSDRLKIEITKFGSLYDRLRHLNSENKNKQHKTTKLRNDILEGETQQILEGLGLVKGLPSTEPDNCTSTPPKNELLSKGKRKNIRIKNRKKRNQMSKSKHDGVGDFVEVGNRKTTRIVFEREQLFQWYRELPLEDIADFQTETNKNGKFREILKQLNMEKSKQKKLMKYFITPDTANTRDWGTLCEEEQPLTNKSAIANANVQIMVEKNKTLLEKIKDMQADNEKKQETINKLKCILIVQQYKAKENLVEDNGKDLDEDEDRGIAANYPLNQSDWIEQGHRIINCTPFEWKISSFSKKLEEIKSEIDKEIFSEPFYSHKFGYKMQLRLRPMGTHLSVFVDLLRGEYDDGLSWPMTRDVAVAFLNQRTKTFQVVYKYRFPSIENEESDGLSHSRDVVNLESVGSPHFIKSFDLLNNSVYKKDKIVLVCFLYD